MGPAAEFFVTATISATFVTTVGLDLWPVIGGLIAGGLIAAPMGLHHAVRSRPALNDYRWDGDHAPQRAWVNAVL
jgi:hypothetical protein